MSDHINIHETKFDKIGVDACGKIFKWNDRLFRAINYESVDTVKNMFTCGMIDELTANRLFPKSLITDFTIEGYGYTAPR